jgi:predicted phosphodiesterase
LEFQIRRIQIPDTKAWINIEPLSDIHIGSKFHDKKKFAEVIQRIKDDPSRYTFIMGDVFDATLPDNKFFDQETQDPELPELEDQFQYALKSLMPIRHKILGVHSGNHDERVRIKHFDNIVLRLVNELNSPNDLMEDYPIEIAPPLPVDENGRKIRIKYLSYMAITRLVFFRKFESGEEHIDSSWDIHTWHGGYSGRRVGGNLNNQEDLAAGWSADIYLSGHTHQIIIDKRVKVSMDQYGKLQEIVKVFAVCGTFMRAYNEGTMSYAELKGYSPQRCGTITVSIQPYDRKIQAHE